jgi:hypothetical protein
MSHSFDQMDEEELISYMRLVNEHEQARQQQLFQQQQPQPRRHQHPELRPWGPYSREEKWARLRALTYSPTGSYYSYTLERRVSTPVPLSQPALTTLTGRHPSPGPVVNNGDAA